MATPHGQRSHANITVIPTKIGTEFNFMQLIDQMEDAIRTPVQTAVKRIDEQEFAKRTGENLMFAEDAARNLSHALDQDSEIADFKPKYFTTRVFTTLMHTLWHRRASKADSLHKLIVDLGPLLRDRNSWARGKIDSFVYNFFVISRLQNKTDSLENCA